jgi:hypothetical protein
VYAAVRARAVHNLVQVRRPAGPPPCTLALTLRSCDAPDERGLRVLGERCHAVRRAPRVPNAPRDPRALCARRAPKLPAFTHALPSLVRAALIDKAERRVGAAGTEAGL